MSDRNNKYVGDIHKVISAATKATETRCLYFDRHGKRCKANAIQSHSLQKQGPLATLAENGHVIKTGQSLKARPIEKLDFFEEQGLQRASTFLGFCSKHDTDVFEEIERKGFSISQRAATILAIRSIALELYRKRVMVSMQQESINILGSNASPDTIQKLRWIERGAKQAVEANVQNLKRLFRDFHKAPPLSFQYICLEFDNQLPFACTGAFEPERDLKGNLLFKRDPLKTGWNFVSIFCGNIGDRFYAIISGYQKYQHHRIDEFISSIDPSDTNLPATLLTMSVAYSENCFFKPSWLNNLPISERDKITLLIRSGVWEGIRDRAIFDVKVSVPPANLISHLLH